MKKQAPTKSVPAPLFCIHVMAYAWTESQAARIKQQVEHMFAGAEVEISENKPEVIPPPAAAEISTAAEVVKTPVVPITSEVLQIPPAKIEPAPAPVKEDQHLRDLHTGAIVLVVEVFDNYFGWANTNPDCPENAKIGICPFANFAECYEILPEGTKVPDSETTIKDVADSVAPDGKHPKKKDKHTAAPKAPRAKKAPAAAHSHKSKHS